jgi:hypothetical protein
MSTFVVIEPDAFGKRFNAVADEQKQGVIGNPTTPGYGMLSPHMVRRPMRGIQIKEDTYAMLQVRKADGTPMPLFDAAAEDNSGTGAYNSNFLIQQIVEQRVEKQQIITTFGDPFIFFFGEQPRSLSITGVLLNTDDFNWRAEWWENYERYLRGTSCVRSNSRVYLSWDEIVVEGYMTKAAAQESSQERNLVHFQFELFLTNYQNISNIGNPKAKWLPSAPKATVDTGSQAKTEFDKGVYLEAAQTAYGASLTDTKRAQVTSTYLSDNSDEFISRDFVNSPYPASTTPALSGPKESLLVSLVKTIAVQAAKAGIAIAEKKISSEIDKQIAKLPFDTVNSTIGRLGDGVKGLPGGSQLLEVAKAIPIKDDIAATVGSVSFGAVNVNTIASVATGKQILQVSKYLPKAPV